MTVALRSPSKVANIISVDNAPVDAALKSDFATYVQGMRKIEDAKPKRQSDADAILKDYAEVASPPPPPNSSSTHLTPTRIFPSANSCSRT